MDTIAPQHVTRRATHANGRRIAALRAGVVLLCVVGIVSATMRLVNTAASLALSPETRPPLQASDRMVATFVIAAMGLAPGSPEQVHTEAGIVTLFARYVDHPVQTVAHLVPGILLLLFVPIQFSRTVRNRYRQLHRWSGRVLLALLLVAIVPAVYFGVVDSHTLPWERPTITLFSGIVIYAATTAYLAIRRRDVARHREWMIRTFAMMIGIGTVRIVSVPFVFMTTASYETITVASMWVGWVLTLGIAEWWIRHTRTPVLQHAWCTLAPCRRGTTPLCIIEAAASASRRPDRAASPSKRLSRAAGRCLARYGSPPP